MYPLGIALGLGSLTGRNAEICQTIRLGSRANKKKNQILILFFGIREQLHGKQVPFFRLFLANIRKAYSRQYLML